MRNDAWLSMLRSSVLRSMGSLGGVELRGRGRAEEGIGDELLVAPRSACSMRCRSLALADRFEGEGVCERSRSEPWAVPGVERAIPDGPATGQGAGEASSARVVERCCKEGRQLVLPSWSRRARLERATRTDRTSRRAESLGGCRCDLDVAVAHLVRVRVVRVARGGGCAAVARRLRRGRLDEVALCRLAEDALVRAVLELALGLDVEWDDEQLEVDGRVDEGPGGGGDEDGARATGSLLGERARVQVVLEAVVRSHFCKGRLHREGGSSGSARRPALSDARPPEPRERERTSCDWSALIMTPLWAKCAAAVPSTASGLASSTTTSMAVAGGALSRSAGYGRRWMARARCGVDLGGAAGGIVLLGRAEGVLSSREGGAGRCQPRRREGTQNVNPRLTRTRSRALSRLYEHAVVLILLVAASCLVEPNFRPRLVESCLLFDRSQS